MLQFSFSARSWEEWQLRESHHFESHIIQLFPSFTPYLFPNNPRRSLYILRLLCWGWSSLHQPSDTYSCGTLEWALLPPGKKEGSFSLGGLQGPVPVFPGPLVGEIELNYLIVAYCLHLKCFLQLSTDTLFILSFIPIENSLCKLTFPRSKGKMRETLTLCICPDNVDLQESC